MSNWIETTMMTKNDYQLSHVVDAKNKTTKLAVGVQTINSTVFMPLTMNYKSTICIDWM